MALMKFFTGLHTSKFHVGQRVHSGDYYPTGRYYGTIVSIGGVERCSPYGVHWDGDYMTNGDPAIVYKSEEEIFPA